MTHPNLYDLHLRPSRLQTYVFPVHIVSAQPLRDSYFFTVSRDLEVFYLNELHVENNIDTLTSPVCHILSFCVITGPPTHSVDGQTSNGRWRLSSSVVCRRL